MRKNIVNQNIGGLGNITTLNTPEVTTDRELVLFGGTIGDTLLNSDIIVSASKDVSPLRSVTFGTTSANPGTTTTVWINSADQRMYLGANPVGQMTVNPIGASPNASGATISAQTITMQPASASFGGVLTAGTQSIAGDKTFTGAITASNLSGTNSGNVTLAAIGASPNANGASLSGQVLTIQPASASFGGIVTNGTQTIAGAKTLSDNLTCSKSIYLPAPNVSGDGAIYTGGNRLIQEWSTSNLFVGRAGNLNTNSTCVGIGLNALANIDGAYFCTAVGVDACAAATTGAHTLTAVGRSALIANTTGIQNIAVGYNAGSAITTTSGNIFIGNTGVLGDAATIKIGTSQTSCSIAGISGRTSSSGIATYINASGVLGTTTSSARFKHDIAAVNKSISSKLHEMRVVEFKYNDDKEDRLQYGMLAEEMNEVMPEIVVHEEDDNTKPVYAIQYHLLIPLLVAEVQEQKKLINSLTAQVNKLNSEAIRL